MFKLRSKGFKVEAAFLLASFAAWGCGEVAEQASAEGQVVEPRWATNFHWSDGGEVLVLEGEPDVRIARGDLSIGQGRELATWSTTHVALLEAFGGLSHWAGGTACNYLQSEAALARLADGRSIDFGNDSGSAMERLLVDPPAAVTVFPFHDPFEGMAMPPGIRVLPITEYLEPHPLGRAEWMRALGWLVGEEDLADSSFAAIEERYLALRRTVGERPRVFTGSVDGDAFWAPSGDSFIAQFLADAGTDYAFRDHRASGSIPVPFERLLELNEEVDAWGLVWYDADSVTWAEVAEAHPVYEALQPPGGRIFVANARTCDYFGALVAAPDALLADLIALFHGEGEGVGCFEWLEVP